MIDVGSNLSRAAGGGYPIRGCDTFDDYRIQVVDYRFDIGLE